MPAPIRGGSPAESWGPETDAFRWELGPAVELDIDDMMADELASLSAAVDRLERGLSHGDAECLDLIGNPASLD